MVSVLEITMSNPNRSIKELLEENTDFLMDVEETFSNNWTGPNKIVSMLAKNKDLIKAVLPVLRKILESEEFNDYVSKERFRTRDNFLDFCEELVK